MPLNRAFIGREFPASGTYEVSREKIRDFAAAIGDHNPAYIDADAARELGYTDVIAPPTFLTVLNFRFALDGPVADPDLDLNYSLVVHGEQRFTTHRQVVAGDVLQAVTTVRDIRDAGRNEAISLGIEVTDAAGEPVATIESTIISRGTAAERES